MGFSHNYVGISLSIINIVAPYQIIFCCFQGFVSAVSHMRSFVPAIYDVTVAIPKTLSQPTMIRLFKGQPSVVSNRI